MLDRVLHDSTTCTPAQNTTNVSACTHVNIITEGNTPYCQDCGMELPSHVITESQTSRLDPGRCQIRKQEEKGIYRDVEHMGFNEQIVRTANKIFAQTTKGQIYRGNSRKAIIFACVFHAFKITGQPQSHESLIEMFNLEKRTGLKGLRIVYLQSEKGSLIRNRHITAQDLIKEIMKKFEAKPEQIAEVEELYKLTKNRSSILNRSRPQSTAAGIVYYYVRREGKDIPMKTFVDKVKLSELTVMKIAKEISNVLNTPEVMV